MHVWRGPLRDAGRGEHGDKISGLPGWQYSFHGKGLCLTAPDGENIDVDEYGDGGLTIDPFFFTARMQSLLDPALPERRLRAFLPTDDVMAEAMRELAPEGVVQLGQNGHVFRIVPELEDAADALADVDFSSREAQDHWTEHLGDYLLGSDPRAPGQRRTHEAYLRGGLARKPGAFIGALETVLPAAEFVATCAEVIDGPVDSAAGRAIECLEAHPAYPFCQAVVRLLQRARPGNDHPYAPYHAARYLLRRGIETSLAGGVALAYAQVDRVAGYVGNPFLGDLALLLLEHVPSVALAQIRRALGSGVPIASEKVVTALAVLDQPWCHRELILALDRATTFEGSALLRTAILRSGAPGAREAVERWVRTHVMQISTGPGYTWDEVLEASAPSWFDRDVQELRPWADRVRPAIDPDFDRVTWA